MLAPALLSLTLAFAPPAPAAASEPAQQEAEAETRVPSYWEVSAEPRTVLFLLDQDAALTLAHDALAATLPADKIVEWKQDDYLGWQAKHRRSYYGVWIWVVPATAITTDGQQVSGVYFESRIDGPGKLEVRGKIANMTVDMRRRGRDQGIVVPIDLNTLEYPEATGVQRYKRAIVEDPELRQRHVRASGMVGGGIGLTGAGSVLTVLALVIDIPDYLLFPDLYGRPIHSGTAIALLIAGPTLLATGLTLIGVGAAKSKQLRAEFAAGFMPARRGAGLSLLGRF